MYEDILAKMTLEQKVRFCNGADQWSTLKIPGVIEHGITTSDGPHGLRHEIFADGKKQRTDPATAFATGSCLANSWDRELAAEVAAAMGRETLAAGVNILLGCGVNIKRNPLCGRNMEYVSEDPVLSGEMGAAWVAGLQSTGAGASLKHFCCNNKEIHRMEQDAVVDARALREIYLKPFEIAVQKAEPATVMTSYNMLNGDYTGEKPALVDGVLRGEWGYDGVVVSDWGAVKDRVKAFDAGEDLEMPYSGDKFVAPVLEAVKNGRLCEDKIDESCKRILALIDKLYGIEAPTVDMAAHHLLARREAEEGAVLLKNEGGLLPVKRGATVCVIGELAKEHPYGGGGSSAVTPTRVESLCDGLDTLGVDHRWFSGFVGKPAGGKVDAAALRAAEQSDVTVVAVGYANGVESEGGDRLYMSIMPHQLALLRELAKTRARLAVVVCCATPVELPFADDAGAILLLGLSGQAGGHACARLLTGAANPSGKLSESWPLRYEDVVNAKSFQQEMYRVHYKESIFVGYRYFQKANKPVRYAFGHGLSYTTFAYSGLALRWRGDELHVEATVTNTGAVAGKEVVQLYIGKPQGGVPNPVRELKDFTKVALAPGQSATVHFALPRREFAVYLAAENRWAVEAGDYIVEVGGGSDSPALRAAIPVEGEALQVSAPAWYFAPDGEPSLETFAELYGRAELEKLPRHARHQKGSFDRTDSFYDIQNSGFLCKNVIKVMLWGTGATANSRDERDPAYATMCQMLLHTPMSTLADVLGASLIDGLLLAANGHGLRGLARMMRKDKDRKYTPSDFMG